MYMNRPNWRTEGHCKKKNETMATHTARNVRPPPFFSKGRGARKSTFVNIDLIQLFGCLKIGMIRFRIDAKHRLYCFNNHPAQRWQICKRQIKGSRDLTICQMNICKTGCCLYWRTGTARTVNWKIKGISLCVSPWSHNLGLLTLSVKQTNKPKRFACGVLGHSKHIHASVQETFWKMTVLVQRTGR